MKIARTKNAMKSLSVGLILKIYQMIVPFFMRTAMIHFMGVQYLGLNSLFSSVLHVLNMAELGVGSAMVFSMYKPIAEDDEKTICALMRLYRKYYRLIGLFIGIIGLCLLPAIPKLIRAIFLQNWTFTFCICSIWEQPYLPIGCLPIKTACCRHIRAQICPALLSLLPARSSICCNWLS